MRPTRARHASAAAALALVIVTGVAVYPASAEDAPPVDAPVDVPVFEPPTYFPPLESPPLEIPTSTPPQGSFEGIGVSPSPTEVPEFVMPRPEWESWTPEQAAAVLQLVMGGLGRAVNTEIGPDGILYAQVVTSGLAGTIDFAGKNWFIITPHGAIQGTGVTSASPTADSALTLEVPASSGIRFIATNPSPQATRVFLAWQFGDQSVLLRKVLLAGETWEGDLNLPAGSSPNSTKGTLVTRSVPAFRTNTIQFENDTVTVLAFAAEPEAKPTPAATAPEDAR